LINVTAALEYLVADMSANIKRAFSFVRGHRNMPSHRSFFETAVRIAAKRSPEIAASAEDPQIRSRSVKDSVRHCARRGRRIDRYSVNSSDGWIEALWAQNSGSKSGEDSLTGGVVNEV